MSNIIFVGTNDILNDYDTKWLTQHKFVKRLYKKNDVYGIEIRSLSSPDEGMDIERNDETGRNNTLDIIDQLSRQYTKNGSNNISVTERNKTTIDSVKTRAYKNMNSFTEDIKNFIKENRSIIYWIIALFLLDHFVFEGKFRDKLKDLAGKMFDKVSKKVEATEVK